MDLRNMSYAELRAHYDAVLAELKYRQTQRQARAAEAFRPGDVVQFTSKYGTPISIRVERVNIKTLVGTELDNPALKWRVAPTLCTKKES